MLPPVRSTLTPPYMVQENTITVVYDRVMRAEHVSGVASLMAKESERGKDELEGDIVLSSQLGVRARWMLVRLGDVKLLIE